MSDYRYYKNKLLHKKGIYLTRKLIGKPLEFYTEYLYIAYGGSQGVILWTKCSLSLDSLIKEVLEKDQRKWKSIIGRKMKFYI